MMDILQFKVGGKYDYNVTFETGLEKQQIQTNDRPTGNLIKAISDVVITAQFRSVTFSYPENGPDGFVLEFTIRTKENVYVKHVLKTDRLSLVEEDTSSTDASFQIRAEQNNTLIGKVLALRDEVSAYAQGARAQVDLPFEDGDSAGTDAEASLFDDDGEGEGDDELDIVAGNISEFKK
jgi:hypothetical protein